LTVSSGASAADSLGDAIGNNRFTLPHSRNDGARQHVEQKSLRTLLLSAQLVEQPLFFETSADTGLEQNGIERFRQIILGSRRDASHGAVELVECGNHDHRNVAGGLLGLQAAKHLEATQIRHDQIEQYEVEIFGSGQRDSRDPALRSGHVISFAPQAARQQIAI
jgi:hypothetical protein